MGRKRICSDTSYNQIRRAGDPHPVPFTQRTHASFIPLPLANLNSQTLTLVLLSGKCVCGSDDHRALSDKKALCCCPREENIRWNYDDHNRVGFRARELSASLSCFHTSSLWGKTENAIRFVRPEGKPDSSKSCRQGHETSGRKSLSSKNISLVIMMMEHWDEELWSAFWSEQTVWLAEKCYWFWCGSEPSYP